MILCVFNLIPIPPLDGSHVLRHVIGMSEETYTCRLHNTASSFCSSSRLICIPPVVPICAVPFPLGRLIVLLKTVLLVLVDEKKAGENVCAAWLSRAVDCRRRESMAPASPRNSTCSSAGWSCRGSRCFSVSGTRPSWSRAPHAVAKAERLLTPTTFSLIHATDFADRYERQLVPLLKAGYIVLCDRYKFTAFARDTVRGCSPDWVRRLYSFAALPDLTFFFKSATGRVAGQNSPGSTAAKVP